MSVTISPTSYDPELSDGANIANALFAIARALDRLGTNDAATPMGAVELLAKEVRDGADAMANSLQGLTDAVDRLAPIE